MIKFRSALFLPLLVVACSSGSEDAGEVVDGFGGAPNGSGTQGPSTTGANTIGGTGSGFVSTTGTFMPTSTSNGMTGGLDPDEVCGGVSLETQPVETEVPREIVTTIETEVPAPVAIYVVLDNSLSMGPAVGGPTGGIGPGGFGPTTGTSSSTTGTGTTTGTTGTSDTTGTSTGTTGGGGGPEPTKWEEAVQALTDFVNDPGSVGIEIGIQYFNPETNGGMADVCDGVVHATPDVDVGPLPDNADAIIDSLGLTGPRDSTPTVGALTGGTNFCATFEAENPDYQCIVVLVTDGQPNGCGLDSGCAMGGSMDCVDPASVGILTPIAATGLTSGVTTFTVGMAGVTADGFALLDAIAVAGGSDCTPGAAGDEACDVSETGSAGLLEALKTIRETIVVTETMTETVTETVIETVALPCQWELPEPPAGETFNPDLVNVVIAVDGIPGEPLGRVPTEGDCAGVGPGWYYDDAEDPSSILVCPTTCDVVTNNGDVNVTVQLGCETEVAKVVRLEQNAVELDEPPGPDFQAAFGLY